MIQKIKNISIIILIILIILSAVYFFYYRHYKNEKIKELQANEKVLNEKQKELNMELEDLKNQKPVTVKEFVYLKDTEKLKEYEKVVKQKDEAIKLAEQYKDQSEKYKKQYEEAIKLASNEIKWGVDILGFGGLNSDYKPEIFAGATINRYFDLKLLTLGLGIGGYGKVYENKGGGLILQIKLLF